MSPSGQLKRRSKDLQPGAVQADAELDNKNNNKTLVEHANEIRELEGRVVKDIVEVGRRLSLCKEMVGHGNWGKWLGEEFGWTQWTARNYMNAYAFWKDNSGKFHDLPDASTLYLLASKSTPDQVRDEVLRRAEEGKTVRHKDVKQLVREARNEDADDGDAGDDDDIDSNIDEDDDESDQDTSNKSTADSSKESRKLKKLTATEKKQLAALRADWEKASASVQARFRAEIDV